MPPIPSSFGTRIQLSDTEIEICHQEISNLCRKGAIERVAECKGQFLSPFFVIQKSSGDWRFILNLKRLNEYIMAPHFKLENWKTVVRLLSPGDFLASIDIQDAYLHLPIRPEDRKFLRLFSRPAFSVQGSTVRSRISTLHFY